MWKATHVCMNQRCWTNYSGYGMPFSQEDPDIEEPIACDYCGHDLYKVDDDTPTHKEIVLFENEHWKVTKFYSGDAGWIIGDIHSGGVRVSSIGSGWIHYSTGGFAYDLPGKIPQYIKERLAIELRKLAKLGN